MLTLKICKSESPTYSAPFNILSGKTRLEEVNVFPPGLLVVDGVLLGLAGARQKRAAKMAQSCGWSPHGCLLAFSDESGEEPDFHESQETSTTAPRPPPNCFALQRVSGPHDFMPPGSIGTPEFLGPSTAPTQGLYGIGPSEALRDSSQNCGNLTQDRSCGVLCIFIGQRDQRLQRCKFEDAGSKLSAAWGP